MIHIDRIQKPAELTDDVVMAKTELFKQNNKQVVWDEKYIKDALLKMSYGKCCYCECDITKESNYMEVEHFHDKKDYPDEVVEWDNLLPSCKKCNATKASTDVVANPIINPCKDIPNCHMYLYNGILFKAKDLLGKTTILELNLNDSDRHCTPRFKISMTIANSLDDIAAATESYIAKLPTRDKLTRLRNKVIGLFETAQKEKEYASVTASNIMNYPDYEAIKNNLIELNVWNDDIQELEDGMKDISYSPSGSLSQPKDE